MDKVVIAPTPIYCPRPQKPILEELDKTKTICDSGNLSILLKDFNNSTSYSLELEAVISCYENSNKSTTKTASNNSVVSDSKDTVKPDVEKKTTSNLLPSFIKFF